MNEQHYVIMYRWIGRINHSWLTWSDLGTYPTVNQAIKAVIEEFEFSTHKDNITIKLTFENNNLIPAKAGDLFWVQVLGDEDFSKIDCDFMIVELSDAFQRRDKKRKPTTFTHPKLETIWNVVDLTALI